jgi:hypothetical protein
MSVYFRLDESLISVAPSLQDVEPILIVRTRFRTYDEEGPDGVVRCVATRTGKPAAKPFQPTQVEGQAIYDTRITPKASEGLAEFETQTVYLAGGAGSVFYAVNRKVRFAARWYGENNRYLELRVQVHPGAEVVANRGMATFRDDSAEHNFLGQLKRENWAEIHIDNHTHVGMSMVIHPTSEEFSRSVRKKSLLDREPQTRTRWTRILED